MDEVYEAELLALEEHHWWYRGRRRVLGALVDAHVPAGRRRILDVGCGSGRNLVELARYGDVQGVEPSEASAAYAARLELPVVRGTADALPFADAEFDLVTALDVIEHIDDDAGALVEMRRVLRPGGLAIVTVPAYQWLWSAHDEMNLHKRRYTSRLLDDRASSAGWSVLRTTYFNSILLPAVAAHRFAQRMTGRNSSPERNDFKRTPRGLNGGLEALMGIEARAIARGLRFPAGVSLAAVLTSR